jgi:hypothetical protein
MTAFRFISSEECRRPWTQSGFAERMTGIQQGAASTVDTHSPQTIRSVSHIYRPCSSLRLLNCPPDGSFLAMQGVIAFLAR